MPPRPRAVFFLLALAGCSRPTPQTPAVVSEPAPGAAWRVALARALPQTPVETSTATAQATGSPTADAGAVPGTVPAAVPGAVPGAVASSAQPDRPLYYTRPITEADLQGRTLRDLALMRNTPYARMGNTFRRPWLAAYFAEETWYHPTRPIRVDELAPLDRQNVDAIGRYDVGLTHDALVAIRDALVARDRAQRPWNGDGVEAMLVGSRLGEHVALSTGTAGDPQETPLDNPDRLDTLLTVAMLRQISPRDLRIVRTMIRARHGRAFRSPMLNEYFGNMAWYSPDPAYNDARLTRVDRQNLRLIQSVEAELGGPITEAEAREEEALASGA